MAYGAIYTAAFDSYDSLMSYNLTIKKKNYTGDPQILLLSGTPVIHEWQEDDPKPPIKGSSLKLSIISNHTEAGFVNVHLTDFFSNEDDTFLIEFKRTETDEILFTGYLVQDDCSEIQIDSAHEINLSFTDNLGLLKDISLYEAAQKYGMPVTAYTDMAADTISGEHYIIFDNTTFPIYVGNIITISNGTGFDGTYTVKEIVSASPFTFKVVEPVNTVAPYVFGQIDYTVPVNLNQILPLSQIIRLCLKSAQLDIGMGVYGNIYPVHGTTGRWLEDTCIDARSFKANDTFMSCYDVLEQIMSRFNATCFQARGLWRVFRWGELFQYITTGGMNFSGLLYDNDFAYTATTTGDDNFTIGNGSDIVSGWLKSIVRPYKYTQEVYNYTQTSDLIKNANLQELGQFRASYPSGGNTVFEYDLPYWVDYDASPGPYPTRFIRVTYDSFGKELERVIVIVDPVYFSSLALQSNDIFINKGSFMTISYDFQSGLSISGPNTWYFQIRLTDGVNTYYLDQFQNWTTTLSVFNQPRVDILSGDDFNLWHTLTLNTNDAPIDGILNIYLAIKVPTGGHEWYFKNFTIDITNQVAGSIKSIGQKHNTSQNITAKNTNEIDIKMDDSPLQTISGCLYLDTTSGIIRNRTTVWNYPTFGVTYEHPLGFWTTFEKLYQNLNPVNKFSGTILNIKDDDTTKSISPMACIIYGLDGTLAGKRFVTGALTIDYKHSTADLTMYEEADEDKTISQVLNESLYNFSYIYESN